MLIDIVQFDQRVGLGTFSGWLTALNCQPRYWRADLDRLPPGDGNDPVILLGGYMGVNERDRLPYLQRAADWVKQVVARGRPLLAICLGGQLLAHALGGRVRSNARQERGLREIELNEAGRADPLFAGLANPLLSFEWHNDSFEPPPGAQLLGSTAVCPEQAFRLQNAWGLQFHPEVDAQVVADWCQRTGAGEQPLREFAQRQQEYLAQSRKLLENFVAAARQLAVQGESC